MSKSRDRRRRDVRRENKKPPMQIEAFAESLLGAPLLPFQRRLLHRALISWRGRGG